MPRTFNHTIGEKILDIIYKHKPLGIWYRQLQREGNLYSKTLTGWLEHLRSHNILYTSRKGFIRFTPKKLEEYQRGDLIVPGVRINERKKLLSESRECKGLLHVLFTSSHLITESKEPVIDEMGIEWGVAIHRPSVKNDTIKKLNRIYKPDNLYPPILENRISGTSLEIFKHLELSKEEAEKYYQFLKDYTPNSFKPYPILVETEIGRKYNNNNSQTVYEIKDKLLQEFINRCLMAFNSGVCLILRYYFKTNRFQILKLSGTSQLWTKEKQINEYKKYMDVWFGSREAYYSFDIFYERSPLRNDVVVDVDKRLERAMSDIHKHSIFDDELKYINKKYKILEEKYPDIIKALLDTLFPKFFRDMIREEYTKNVTIKSNLNR